MQQSVSNIRLFKKLEFEFGEKQLKVGGMPLYARIDEIIQPDNVYHMRGNIISEKPLDLNREFFEIAGQLNSIAEDHFGIAAVN